MGKTSKLVTALAPTVAIASPIGLRSCVDKNQTQDKQSKEFVSTNYDKRLIRAIYKDISHPEYPAEILNDSTYRYTQDPQTQYRMDIEDIGYDDKGTHSYSVNFEATSSTKFYSLPSDTTKPAVKSIW